MSNRTQPYGRIQNKRRKEGEYPAQITRAYHRKEGKFIPIGYRVVWIGS